MNSRTTDATARDSTGGRWTRSRTVPLVGVLFAATGVLLLAAIPFAAVGSIGMGVGIFDGPGAVTLLVLAAAVLLLAAGVGLLRRRAWGWTLGMFIALSGMAVIGVRLVVSGGADWPMLWPPLLTNALVAFVLLRARPPRLA